MKKTFEKQLAYAIKHHGNQTRKKVGDCRIPYIIHPLDVMRQLQGWGIVDSKYEQLWTAALFHDLLEDTDLTLSQLADDWGAKVASIVDELTFKGDDRNLEAKAEYVASFVDKSIEALILKIADRLCNTADSMSLPNGMEKAKSVFEKGTPLWSTFTKRFAEIRDCFGDDTAVEIGKGIATYSLAFAPSPSQEISE